MQFAIFGSAQADSERPGAALGEGFHEFVEFKLEAEALGFCASFLVGHHFTGWNEVSATLQLLTRLAARTTTLRLGTAVPVLPWHNPVLLAEQAATLARRPHAGPSRSRPRPVAPAPRLRGNDPGPVFPGGSFPELTQ
jgi:hypothetical protein